MASRYAQAELLIALWKLGSVDDTLLPTSHGILDRALRECFEILPEILHDDLTFSVTNVGLRCYELPDILLAAQETLLTSEPNPTYLSTMVTLDNDTAKQIVIAHGLSTERAQEVGRKLQDAVAGGDDENAAGTVQMPAA